MIEHIGPCWILKEFWKHDVYLYSSTLYILGQGLKPPTLGNQKVNRRDQASQNHRHKHNHNHKADIISLSKQLLMYPLRGEEITHNKRWAGLVLVAVQRNGDQDKGTHIL